jgi:hypothetical protein
MALHRQFALRFDVVGDYLALAIAGLLSAAATPRFQVYPDQDGTKFVNLNINRDRQSAVGIAAVRIGDKSRVRQFDPILVHKRNMQSTGCAKIVAE